MVSAGNRLKSRTLTIIQGFLKILKKPRLGRRRMRGIWPPSKAGLIFAPERDFCPLWPRQEVLPCPEPIPRPTRFLLCFDPGDGCSSSNFMINQPFVGCWYALPRDGILAEPYHEPREYPCGRQFCEVWLTLMLSGLSDAAGSANGAPLQSNFQNLIYHTILFSWAD